MIVDRYTKVVLTLIAVGLFLNIFSPMVAAAEYYGQGLAAIARALNNIARSLP